MSGAKTLRCIGDHAVLASALEVATRTGFEVGDRADAAYHLASLDHPIDELEALCRLGCPENIVWIAGRGPVPYDWLASKHVLHRLASTDTEERLRDLQIILNTMHAPSAWKPELHFEPGRETTSLTLTSSADKEDALADVDRFFTGRSNLPPVRRSQLVQIRDELFTNALFNAPVDEAGTHQFRNLDRREHAELAPGQAIDISLWADDDRFGVAVRDPFGSLAPDRISGGLARGFRRGDDQISSTGGGAGLGLFTVYRASSHLTASVIRGRSTQILAVLDTPSKRFAAVRGLNAFWSDG